MGITLNFLSKFKNKFIKNKKIDNITYNSVFTENNIVLNPYKHKTFFPKNYKYNNLVEIQCNYNNLHDDYYYHDYDYDHDHDNNQSNLNDNSENLNNTFGYNYDYDYGYRYDYGVDYYSDIGSFHLRRSISLITQAKSEIDIIEEIIDLY